MYRRNKGLGKPTEIRKKDVGKCSGSLARAQQGFRQMTRSAPLFGFQLGQAKRRIAEPRPFGLGVSQDWKVQFAIFAEGGMAPGPVNRDAEQLSVKTFEL